MTVEVKTISASEFSKMFLAGAKYLEANKDTINELNVFPVPDGDTGTNMTMTMMSAAKEVVALDDPDMASLCKAISSGSLRGARGNSGVILSQIFRGFTKVVKTCDELTTAVIAEACQKSVESAYKAVMKPKEGTILTVAKAAADKAQEMAAQTDDIVVLYEAVIAAADESLSRTPDLLPVLKQAGVVDSGGRGLLEVLRGGYDCMCGKQIDLSIEGVSDSGSEAPEAKELPKYLYRMSFAIKSTGEISGKDIMDYKVYLEAMGEDVSVEDKSSYVSVIIMTNEPGRVITRASKMGTLSQVSLINIVDDEPAKEQKKDAEIISMPVKEQEDTTIAEEPKDMGFVAVSIGKGINQCFRDLGADYIIEGGQTMNPSTDDILSAVEKVNAKSVFVLPNNKNIILAANQAAKLCKDKNVIVIPTKTIPQGMTALINFMPDSDVSENEKQMTDSLATVCSGEVTYAVRDTVINDKEITQGDYMGIGDEGILSVNKDLTEVVLEMFDQIIEEGHELISLYYGADVKKREANKMKKAVAERFPDMDVELLEGGQPVYYYVTSVE